MAFALGSWLASKGGVESESIFWGVTPCLQGSGNVVPLLGPEKHSDTRTVLYILKEM